MPDAAARESARRPLIAAAIAAALALASHLPFITNAFGDNLEGVNSGRYTGCILRHLSEGGWWRMRGRTLAFAVPTDPVSGEVYANHPPLCFWAGYPFVRLFGLNEATVRIVPILCSSLASAILAWWLGRRLGLGAALMAGVLFAAMPASWFYGQTADMGPPLLLVGVVGAVAVLESESRPRLLWIAVLAELVGVWVDWSAVGLVPAFLLMQPPCRLGARVRFACLLGAAGLLGIGAYVALLIAWEGTFAIVWQRLLAAHDMAQHGAGPFTFGAFLYAQGRHLTRLYGCLGMAATVVGLVYLARAWRSPVARMAFGFLLFTLIPVIGFPGRTFDHESFWFYLLPTVVVASAALCHRMATDWRPLVAWVLVLLVCVENGVRIGLWQAHEDRTTGRLVAAPVNEIADRDTLLSVPKHMVGLWEFYAEPWIVPRFPSWDAATVIDRFQRGDFTVRRLLIAMDPDSSETRDVSEVLERRGIKTWRHGAMLLAELKR